MASRRGQRYWGAYATKQRQANDPDEPYFKMLIAAVKLAKRDAEAAKEPHRQEALRWIETLKEDFSR